MNPLLLLALIPVVGIILFIYFNDKKEKEPFGFLISLFFLGMATVVSAIILELIGDAILNAVMPYESIGKGFADALLIVAPAEELGKYVVLRLRTWKSKHFDYSYDAIVYAVFVSMGFAAFENVEYVFMGGIATALSRMLTAVPGHAFFAVYMGYFYSKAKLASTNEKTGQSILFKLLAMLVPILFHGIYDGILFAGEVDDMYFSSTVSLIVWICFVVTLFAASIVLIIVASRHDHRVIPEPPVVEIPKTQPMPAAVYGASAYGASAYGASAYGAPSYGTPTYGGAAYGASGQGASAYGGYGRYGASTSQNGWTCTCGSSNVLSYCPKCGKMRPANRIWTCPTCGNQTTLNFCNHCGTPKPLGTAGSSYGMQQTSPYQKPSSYQAPAQVQSPSSTNPYLQQASQSQAQNPYMRPQFQSQPAAPQTNPYIQAAQPQVQPDPYLQPAATTAPAPATPASTSAPAPSQPAAPATPAPAPSPFVPSQPASAPAPAPASTAFSAQPVMPNASATPFQQAPAPSSSFKPPVQNPPM